MTDVQLHDALEAFATHLRSYDEPDLASAVEGAKDGPPDRLAQRVVSLFTHGMGGLLDRPLYRDGQVDRDATMQRDALADRLHAAAVARLS